MTDEGATVEAVDDKTTVADQGDDIESKARKQGWVPKDEFKGDPDNWKPAKQFVEFGGLITEVKDLKGKLENLGKETTKAIATIRKNAAKEIESLKAEKAAIVEKGGKGAAEAVEKIDEQIDEIKEAAKVEVKATETDDKAKAEVIADWQIDNPWFETDATMTKYAERISNGYYEDHPKCTMAENLAYVDKKMRAKFPDFDWDNKAPKTETARANGHARVDGGSMTPGFRPKSEPDIPEEDLAVGRQLVAAKAFPDLKAWKKSYLGEKANA